MFKIKIKIAQPTIAAGVGSNLHTDKNVYATLAVMNCSSRDASTEPRGPSAHSNGGLPGSALPLPGTPGSARYRYRYCSRTRSRTRFHHGRVRFSCSCMKNVYCSAVNEYDLPINRLLTQLGGHTKTWRQMDLRDGLVQVCFYRSLINQPCVEMMLRKRTRPLAFFPASISASVKAANRICRAP